MDLTVRGNPVFTGGLGWLDCEVIEAFELGDATAFLGAVVDTKDLRQGRPLVWSEIRPQLPETWLAEWERKIAADIDRSRASMHWSS